LVDRDLAGLEALEQLVADKFALPCGAQVLHPVGRPIGSYQVAMRST
jgi:hypothetical protein